MFDSDKPIKRDNEDELNRMSFVKKLAKSITLFDSENCLVLALMGEWGCGKSSILNLTFNEIKKEKDDWIFVEFDPWYFSNQDNLILQFFNTLFNQLNFSKKIGRKAKNTFKRFIKGMSLSVNYKFVSANFNFDKMLYQEEYKKFTSYKIDLENIFLNLDFKIIISIDNIDRLTDDEVIQIFSLVHSLADLPNVIYILTFDNKLILNVLNGLNIYSPEDFLKKIIQIPIAVPQVTESNLELLMHKYIEPIYNQYILSESMFLDNGFSEVVQYLKPFLKNLRDLKRYVNILKFYCSDLIEEINIVDFMLLLAIQTFQNVAYHEIKNNKELLTITYDDQQEFMEVMQNLFDRIEGAFHNFDRLYINRLMQYMFPQFQEIFYPLIVKRRVLNEKFRICDSEHFNKYFTLSLEESEVSELYMDTLINLDEDELSKEFILLRDNNKLNHFLDKFYKKIDELNLESSKRFIHAFFNVADDFFNDLILYNSKVNIILNKLFDKLNSNDVCFNILMESLNNSGGIFTMLEFIYGIGFDYGVFSSKKSESNKQLCITLEQFEILQKEVYEKIKKLQSDGQLKENNYLSILLKYWADISDENEVKVFVNTITQDDSDLIKFLHKFRRNYYYNLNSEYDFDFEKIKRYSNWSEIYERIKNLKESDSISVKEKEFCKYFLSKYRERLSNNM